MSDSIKAYHEELEHYEELCKEFQEEEISGPAWASHFYQLKKRKQQMSDDKVTIDNYQGLAGRTECSHKRAFERLELHFEGRGGYPPEMSMRLLHAVIGIMGEVGELASALEGWLWYGKPFDLVNFKEEIGDSEWYLAEALNAIEARLQEVLQSNIDKLRQRYPNRFTEERAANRDLQAEREALEKIVADAKPLSNQGWSQTGNGFAEPPDESEVRAIREFKLGSITSSGHYELLTDPLMGIKIKIYYPHNVLGDSIPVYHRPLLS